MAYQTTQTAPRDQTRTGDPLRVPTYLVAAVLVTVFCFVPTGVAAVIFAGRVSALLAGGDVEAARRASRTAKRLCWVSLSVTVTFLVIIVVGADGYSSH
ncbi:MAG: CD225/dispanin family protein [Actinomycetes bacterium]